MGGLHEVSRLLSLKVRQHRSRQDDSLVEKGKRVDNVESSSNVDDGDLETPSKPWCFLTSQESRSYNLCNLASLTDLDLLENYFVRVPINIHEVPRPRRLNLDYCPKLKVLPELPSRFHNQELYCTRL
ncbi:hypothetical protein HN51_045752 [Arachis hypogaea]|uniref:Disease resistance protein n=1 Tax=Arachis hypogaea TaxID=3818 RepID=A0A444XXP3_ARAHY|nr:hypothetical protein Ahy_B08g089295 [Arachis hypogaea]